MKTGDTRSQKGFLQLIIILVLLVVILSLLGVSLSTLFENKKLQENFGFIGQGLAYLWSEWLGAPAQAIWDFLWGGFVRELIWEPAKSFLFSLKAK